MFKNLIFSLAFLTTSLIGASFDDGANAFYKRDYKTAFTIFEDFAKQGDVSAQYNLGMIYYNGFGVDQDYKKAIKWYKKSYDNAYINACDNYKKLNQEGY